MTDYKITNVDFSWKTDVEEKESGFDRVTKLQAHVVYEYQGLYNTTEYGTVVVELATIGTSSADEDGNFTSFSAGTLPTYDDIMDEIVSVVEAKIESEFVVAQEDSFIKTYIAEVRKLEDSEGHGFPSRYTPTPTSYDELNEWNTGIGTIGYNEI